MPVDYRLAFYCVECRTKILETRAAELHRVVHDHQVTSFMDVAEEEEC